MKQIFSTPLGTSLICSVGAFIFIVLFYTNETTLQFRLITALAILLLTMGSWVSSREAIRQKKNYQTEIAQNISITLILIVLLGILLFGIGVIAGIVGVIKG